MSKKAKFKPLITRIKLNPEQTVLACNCYDQGRLVSSNQTAGSTSVCSCAGDKNSTTLRQCSESTSSSS